VRTALGVAVLTFCTILGFAGSDDVLAVAFNMSVNSLVWFFRIGLLVAPLIAGVVTYKLCLELQRRDGPFVDPLLAGEQSQAPPGGDGDDHTGDDHTDDGQTGGGQPGGDGEAGEAEPAEAAASP
jgi:ubiquinol-cytochrome c reductase cytochrome b subunit